MAYRKWKPSKTAIRNFVNTMNEIDDFCSKNGIIQSASSDSYYFTINGQSYRVSNHTIELSNARAFDEYGNQTRVKYHDDKRSDDVVYIHASKTRIIEIYSDLINGYKLNGNGNRI